MPIAESAFPGRDLELNNMSRNMLRSLCCGCNVEPRTRDKNQVIESEDDLLLPGGDIEWDKASRSFISRNRGDYVPPDVPNTAPARLPIIEEFRFLRTLGRGTFGKVNGYYMLMI